MTRISRIRDLFRLYRVRDWVHFLPLPLAGWYAGNGGNLGALVGGVLGWGCALAYASSINQAFDDRLDRANVGKNPVGASFRRRQAVLLSIPPGIATMALVAWLSPAGVVPAVVLLIAATIYSAPPRLKRIPVLATFWNVVIGVPGLFFAGHPDISQGPLRVLVGLFAVLLFVAQLIHEAEDRDDDRSGGIITVGTLTGMKGAFVTACISLALLPGITWWLARGLDRRLALTLASTVFAVSWAAVLINRIRRNERTGLRAMRLNYRYAAIAMGTIAFAVLTL